MKRYGSIRACGHHAGSGTLIRSFPERLGGVWSATPTPFTARLTVDKVAVKRLVEHHLRLGVRGLFLGGTCGEGPWMPDRERRTLVQSVVAAARGRLTVAAQVTDNSAARILDNMRAAAEDGADIAVIAPPYFLLNATPANVEALYLEAIRRSPLPVGIYDRGRHAAVAITTASLARIIAEPKVVLLKDSSADPVRRQMALAARVARPVLCLLNGNEFDCVSYLAAGYDGLLLGGGIFNGRLAGEIVAAVRAGRLAEARRLQARMNRMMSAVYGGPKIACWMAGLKHLLVEMGIFRTTRGFLNYPLTPACRRAIARIRIREAAMLQPAASSKTGRRRTKTKNPK
ncbi:MAG: dihydrodipicolinate synthase family protein [Candidatus Marinimicrobia bacterium]|nr:dihydrodipicolinate synthase family protein [Candidatus Neomarinimicrobiota bacterium]